MGLRLVQGSVYLPNQIQSVIPKLIWIRNNEVDGVLSSIWREAGSNRIWAKGLFEGEESKEFLYKFIKTATDAEIAERYQTIQYCRTKKSAKSVKDDSWMLLSLMALGGSDD